MVKINTEKLLNELNNKWNGKLCPFCGGKWVVSDKIFELREYSDGNMTFWGPISGFLIIVISLFIILVLKNESGIGVISGAIY